MVWKTLRSLVVLAVLSAPLGGCLETIGHPSYNHSSD
jgi:hypothetical protein